MSNFVVGLTGGIGSGKSAAADHFASHGIAIVDADIASRAVVAPGQPALVEIRERFGPTILLDDGSLDRTQLRHIVFAKDEDRKWLQRLLHPLINSYLRTHLDEASSPYALLVNPLLFETQQNTWCKRSLVIDTPTEEQIKRTMQRDNNTKEQVENIVRVQASREQRLSLADDIILNDKDLEHLFEQVDKTHQTYLTLCQN